VRITTIYEGTTAIQSNDFIGRKLARDRGAAMAALLADLRADLRAGADSSAASVHEAALEEIRVAVLEGVECLERAVQHALQAWTRGPEHALAVSVPLLRLAGYVLGGWMHARAAKIAVHRLATSAADADFLRGKLASARFYVTHVLPLAHAQAKVVQAGAASVLETDAALV
jgi:acyl-CoA dehydrogenase